MSETQDTGYQTGDEQEHYNDAYHSADIEGDQDEEVAANINSFRSDMGLPPREQEQEDREQEAVETEEGSSTETEAPRDEKGRYIKVNKEQVFVPESDYETYLQKGANYDKVKGRSDEYQSALDEVARMQGFKDHAELLEQLPAIKEQRKQQESEGFDLLRQQLRQEAEEIGLDGDAIDNYIDRHPAVQRGKEAIARLEQLERDQEQQKAAQQSTEAWGRLFAKYDGLSEQVAEDGSAPWMTPEMIARIEKGYDPIDAYELAHMGNLAQETRRKTEQQVLKQNRLNKRAGVDAAVSGSREDVVPQELASGFAAFGLNPDLAKRHVKDYQNRR